MLRYRNYCIEIETYSKGYQAIFYERPESLLPGVEPTYLRTAYQSTIHAARRVAKSRIRQLSGPRKAQTTTLTPPQQLIQQSLF